MARSGQLGLLESSIYLLKASLVSFALYLRGGDGFFIQTILLLDLLLLPL